MDLKIERSKHGLFGIPLDNAVIGDCITLEIEYKGRKERIKTIVLRIEDEFGGKLFINLDECILIRLNCPSVDEMKITIV